MIWTFGTFALLVLVFWISFPKPPPGRGRGHIRSPFNFSEHENVPIDGSEASPVDDHVSSDSSGGHGGDSDGGGH